MIHKISQEQVQALINLAKQGKNSAYAPYSNYPVGASVMTEDGSVYYGCNIENASYGLTNCAERTAIFKAVSEGKRELIAIAVIADSESYASPCGACRQVLIEFGRNADVILVNKHGDYRVMTSQELLPGAFTPDELDDRQLDDRQLDDR